VFAEASAKHSRLNALVVGADAGAYVGTSTTFEQLCRQWLDLTENNLRQLFETSRPLQSRTYRRKSGDPVISNRKVQCHREHHVQEPKTRAEMKEAKRPPAEGAHPG